MSASVARPQTKHNWQNVHASRKDNLGALGNPVGPCIASSATKDGEGERGGRIQNKKKKKTSPGVQPGPGVRPEQRARGEGATGDTSGGVGEEEKREK